MFLSIVLPIYNIKTEYIRECLDSCLKQNISSLDYEIICVNDGSTNNCLSVLKDYEGKYANIYLYSQKNMGVSGARNTGLSLAKGDYIWFLDPDDFIAHNSLLMIKEKIIEKEVDRLHLGAYHFLTELTSEEKQLASSWALKPNHTIVTDASTVKCIYKRKVLVENNLTFVLGVLVGQDELFNFEFNQITHTEDILDKAIYFYRIHNSSATHSTDKLKFARKFINSHLIGCKIAKGYYDKDKTKKLKTIRYLHSDIAQIMVNIAQLPFPEAKVFLKRVVELKLFPYVKWFSIKTSICLYTNLHSCNLSFICHISKSYVFFWIIKIWARIWSSKIKKRVEKYVKNRIGKVE